MSQWRTARSTVQPGLIDSYGREVRSLRLSVTQRCDLSCPHCHREGQLPSKEEMTAGEIQRLVSIGASLGIVKVKLTGGEPLVREDVVDIVRGISGLVREVSLTTNGSRLSELAQPLKTAGLARVNVSLHTLDSHLYEEICGKDLRNQVVKGISEAVRIGLNPVKINMVVFNGKNNSEIDGMIEFSGEVGAVLQLIEYEADRDGATSDQFAEKFFSLRDVEASLTKMAADVSVNELHRRKRYTIPSNGTKVVVEVVRPMHNTEFCSNCRRIRLSSDGRLKPCLLDSEGSIDVLTPMRAGASDDAIREMFRTAVGNRRPYWR